MVRPSNTPERIFASSGSRRWVTKREVPGRRLSRKGCRSAVASNGMPGGQPSITQPIAGPWLSPHVVKRNASPKLLPAMNYSFSLKSASRAETPLAFRVFNIPTE